MRGADFMRESWKLVTALIPYRLRRPQNLEFVFFSSRWLSMDSWKGNKMWNARAEREGLFFFFLFFLQFNSLFFTCCSRPYQSRRWLIIIITIIKVDMRMCCNDGLEMTSWTIPIVWRRSVRIRFKNIWIMLIPLKCWNTLQKNN